MVKLGKPLWQPSHKSIFWGMFGKSQKRSLLRMEKQNATELVRQRVVPTTLDSGFIAEIDPETLKNNVTTVLRNMDMIGYHKRILGGQRNDDDIKQLSTIYADVIVWTYNFRKHRQIQAKRSGVLAWTYLLLVQYFGDIEDYSKEELLKNRNLKPQTIINILNLFLWYVNWYKASLARRFQHLSDTDIGGQQIHNAIKTLTAKYKNDSNLYHLLNNSIDQKIQRLQWPHNGLGDLQAAILEIVPELLRVKTMIKNQNFDKQAFNKFMGVLYVTFYVYSPQGRIFAITNIQLNELTKFLNENMTFGVKFKSAKRYGLQPILLPDVTKRLLVCYAKYIRPFIMVGKPPTNNLFVNYQGNISICITYVWFVYFSVLYSQVKEKRLKQWDKRLNKHV
jgi:hypothetical protein